VASSRDRQRRLARAKLDRQMARRAGRVRRRRRIQAATGAAVALLLIAGGVAWLAGAFDKKPADNSAAGADTCAWTPQDASTNTDLRDVGTPPTKGVPTSGTRPLTITTNQGAPIGVTLDLAAAPCGGEDLAYLAGKQFYDNTECTEITTEGALHCGDPKGTGLGGPTYSVYNENLPTKPDPKSKAPLYPKGTVALVGNPPGTNGSQFLIFFRDFTPKGGAQYSIVGRVTTGMDTVAKIAKIPTVANNTGATVKPKEKVLIQSLTVGPPAPAAPSSAAPSSAGPPPAGPSASAQS
jgi:peptidyl-prolyl cis-trans isomerase B (cyclophilin B)